MRKISFVRLCLSVLILFSTFACEKNDVIPSKETTTQSDYVVVDGVLTFSSDEACQRTVEMVNKMTEEELLAWEKSINFRSLGTIADQFYYSIDFDKFSSLEELIGFFNNNSDKLLVENKNGEYYFEPSKMGNVNRYIINEDGIFVIRNMAYKELANRIVSVPINKINELKSVSNTSNKEYPMFIGAPDDYNSPGTVVEHFNINSKYKMVATLGSVINNTYTLFEGAHSRHELRLILKNYVKNIFGGWSAHRSTTSCYIKIIGSYEGGSQQTYENYFSEVLDDSFECGIGTFLSSGFFVPNIQTYLRYYKIEASNWKGCVIYETHWVNINP